MLLVDMQGLYDPSFHNVPVDEALLVIAERLQQDTTLEERTSISILDLCHLVELCLKSTYFQFGGSCLEQLKGEAMGSPLSPIVANIFMEALKTRALEMSPCKLKMWLRYMDDVFTIWPHGDDRLKTFHQHFNEQNSSLQFTIEREAKGKIAFLSVQLESSGTKALTSVFRKKTRTDRYLNFNSHQNTSEKSCSA